MDRRSFLRGAAVAPIAVTGAAVQANSAPEGYERVSTETGDPGERAYAMACGDGKRIKVYLDGVEQQYCLTADARQGWVKRHVITEQGNVAFNRATEEILTEVVHGRVEIALV
ncbi:hypothetical protein MesoLjLc_50800 [Mesorhizobium sp. L-8-10]|uniref:twin-arginine translocation signal domain-containing protein n=1 Tax=Mesorhizobium sp. L-8-10 TaxID=2744523 RepID=UPI001927C047|nr:twin-arginine translocation signal domain-containing protein [Mesorhizobium sp. L-8-10]BCH33150.1 hypothetical protein MesoLjLc_50800 [Mesorhizobium sp. L-8-10]